MSKIRGTLFLVKIKQGKTKHEHNEKFKRIAAWAERAQLTMQAGKSYELALSWPITITSISIVTQINNACIAHRIGQTVMKTLTQASPVIHLFWSVVDCLWYIGDPLAK